MGDCHGCPNNIATLAPPPGMGAPARSHIVAIVGPPNSGKSTLFNRLTGLRQKVANFPGVTVEHRMGKVKLDQGRDVFVVDLPGVYSLTPRTEDERVTHDVLSGRMKDLPRPDAVLLILDSTNLSRHLVLAAPVLSLGLPTLVILNMADDLKSRGGELNVSELAMQLGSPVALISAAKGMGVEKIFQFLSGTTIGAAPKAPLIQLPVIQDIPKCRAWATNIGKKTGYHAPAPPLWTRRLDAFFLHPVAGPLVFLFVVVAVFQTIFNGARPLMDGIDELIKTSGIWLGHLLPNEALRSLLIDGIWTGVGSVIIFLPQILLLFLFIGILEDSGYLARAALIADRTMARFGLQGKSFIPLLSAYACAVPAIMATRTIEDKRDRIATILIAPFMTCSARLPVYILIIGAFIPDKNVLGPFLGMRAAVLLGLYILGFVAAILTARLLKSTVLKSRRSSFMLEMPPYRWPTARSLALRLVDRSKVFLMRAGTVILGVAIVIWALSYLPLHEGKPPAIENSFASGIGHFVEPAIKPLGFNWKIGIGLVTSLAARETIVSTLGTIYAPRPGTVDYAEGQVAMGGQNLDAKSIGAEFTLGQSITTLNGKAEILLTPGVFLRLGPNTSATLVAAGLADTRIRLDRGHAMIEVDQIFSENHLGLTQGSFAIDLLKKGSYDFDAAGKNVRVFDGAAVATGGTHRVELNGGQELNTSATSDAKANGFDKKTFHGDIYDWGRDKGLQQALHQDMTLGGAVALLVFFAFAMQCMSTIAVVRRETGGWFWPGVQFAYMTGLAYLCAFVTNHLASLWA